MPLNELIAGSLMLVLFLLTAIYVSFVWRNKGPILLNDWLALSKTEKARADKRPFYRFARNFYGLLALFFLNATFFIFTDAAVTKYLNAILIVIILIYAVASGIFRINKPKN